MTRTQSLSAIAVALALPFSTSLAAAQSSNHHRSHHSSTTAHRAQPTHTTSHPTAHTNATVASSPVVLVDHGPEHRELRFEGTGGGIVLSGGDLAGHEVAGGRIDVRVGDQRTGATAQWPVSGGVVTLTGGGVALVSSGTLHVTRDGHGSWALSGGNLDVSHPIAHDSSVTRTAIPQDLDPPALDVATDPTASGNAHQRGPVQLDSRTLGALDLLASLAPRGSRDAIRQASANEVTIHNSESATPAIYNIPITGQSVVLVVDTSYSMSDRDPSANDDSIDPSSPPSKLDVARAELVKVLASLPSSTMANIVAFSSDAQTLWPAPHALDDASLEQAIRWIAALRPGDETAPIHPVQMANEMHPNQIVFISDGRPTNQIADDNALLQLAEAITARHARLDIVGIGVDQDASFLETVALRGSGTARHR